MKTVLLSLLIITFLIPKHAKAQKEAEATAAIVGGLVAIGAGIAAIEQMEENAEYTATQWMLSNQPDVTSFSLKTFDFVGKKLRDVSAASVITFEIQLFSPKQDPILDGEKLILFAFTSIGWINEYGIDYTKVKWFLFDRSEWMNMMVAYVKVSSDEKNETNIQNILTEGKVVNKGVKVKSNLVIPFFNLSGDMYVVTDYSPEMKLLYNERSLGIFLKDTKDLVQIGREDIVKIHEYFFGKN